MPETLSIGSVREGARLPPLDVPVTRTLIVAGALASQDFTPVHHDAAAARAAGVSDVFMNILTTNGLVGRFVTDWAGPDATIRRVAIRLGAPNLPGDTLVLKGSVTEVDARAGEVSVAVTGRNSWGDHVKGTVVVGLPTDGRPGRRA